MPINQQVEKVNAALSRMSPQQLMSMLQDKNNPYLYLVTSRLAQLKEMQQPKPPPPQGTVTDRVAQALMQPPMPPQGIAAAMPPGMAMPPQMPPQAMPAAMPPQMPPQAMPPQAMPPQMPPQGMQAGGHVHDYGVATLPYEPHYEHGGIVSFQGGGLYSSDPSGDYRNRTPLIERIYDPLVEFFTEDIPEALPKPLNPERIRIDSEKLNKEAPQGTPYNFPYNQLVPGKSSATKSSGLSMTPRDVAGMLNDNAYRAPSITDSGYPGFADTRNELERQLKDYEAAANANATPALTFGDIAKTRLEAQKANPDFDPDFFKNRKEGYQKDINELKDRAAGELLTGVIPRAFLEMAGTPGGFLKGLTAGAKKGVEEFDTSTKGIRETREKLKDRMLREDEIKQTAAAGQVDAAMQLKAKNESDIRAEQANLAAKLFEAKTGMSLKEYEVKVGAAEAQRQVQIANQNAAVQIQAQLIGLQKNLDDNQNAVLLETIKASKEGRLTPDAFLKTAAPLMPEIEARVAQEESEQKIKLSPEEWKTRVNQLLREQLGPVMQAYQLYNTQNSPPKGIVSIRPAP